MKKLMIASAAAGMMFIAGSAPSFADNQGHNASMFGASDLYHMESEFIVLDGQIMKMHHMIQAQMAKIKKMQKMHK